MKNLLLHFGGSLAATLFLSLLISLIAGSFGTIFGILVIVLLIPYWVIATLVTTVFRKATKKKRLAKQQRQRDGELALQANEMAQQFAAAHKPPPFDPKALLAKADEDREVVREYRNTPKAAGVYGIVDFSRQSIYVGESGNIARRWDTHRRDLEEGKHSCSHLQKAFTENPESFSFVVLHPVSAPVKADDNPAVKDVVEKLEYFYWKIFGFHSWLVLNTNPIEAAEYLQKINAATEKIDVFSYKSSETFNKMIDEDTTVMSWKVTSWDSGNFSNQGDFLHGKQPETAKTPARDEQAAVL